MGLSFVNKTLRSLTKAYPKTVTVISETIVSQYNPVTGTEEVEDTSKPYSVLKLPTDTAIYMFPSGIKLTTGSSFFAIDKSQVVVTENMKIVSDGITYHVSAVQDNAGTQYVLANMLEGGSS